MSRCSRNPAVAARVDRAALHPYVSHVDSGTNVFSRLTASLKHDSPNAKGRATDVPKDSQLSGERCWVRYVLRSTLGLILDSLGE